MKYFLYTEDVDGFYVIVNIDSLDIINGKAIIKFDRYFPWMICGWIIV